MITRNQAELQGPPVLPAILWEALFSAFALYSSDSR